MKKNEALKMEIYYVYIHFQFLKGFYTFTFFFTIFLILFTYLFIFNLILFLNFA